jgi:aromatic ring-cleaving dioxygenase
MRLLKPPTGNRDCLPEANPALVPIAGACDIFPNHSGGSVMNNASARSPDVHGYHAHVYYANDTLPLATKLREALAAKFPVELGRFSGEPIGPHPVAQFQVIFKQDAFHSVVPWLMLNREGLDILVHPLTDDMVDDHTVYALWLGTPIKLKLDTMQRRGYSAALLPAA